MNIFSDILIWPYVVRLILCHILNLSTLAPHKHWQRSRSPNIPHRERERERGEGEQIKQHRGYKNKIRKIWHKKRGENEWSKPLNSERKKKKGDRKNRAVRKGGPVGKKGIHQEVNTCQTHSPQIMPDRQTHTMWTLLVILSVNWHYNVLTWWNQRDLASKIGQEMEKDWETESGCAKQGTVWMARVGLKTGNYWFNWQEWGQLQAMQMGLMNGNTGPPNWAVIKGSRHYLKRERERKRNRRENQRHL